MPMEILDFCLTHYWMGVIVGFITIFLNLKIRYVTDFEGKFRKKHYLFLVLSLFSWLVPVAYVVWFIGCAVYFIVFFIVSFFYTYD